jgi:hypothetical protein
MITQKKRAANSANLWGDRAGTVSPQRSRINYSMLVVAMRDPGRERCGDSCPVWSPWLGKLACEFGTL